MKIDSDSSCSEHEPFDKVSAWFIGPIRDLYKIRREEADGAFLAMSASLAMYERYLIKVLQGKGGHPENDRMKQGATDLGISEDSFRYFWGCFRDGLQHQFQPTKIREKRFLWSMSDSHGEIPDVTVCGPKEVIVKINPWKFAELVNRKYCENAALFEQAKSHRPGTIRERENDPRDSHVMPYSAEAGESLREQFRADPATIYQDRCLETGHFHLPPMAPQPATKKKTEGDKEF